MGTGLGGPASLAWILPVPPRSQHLGPGPTRRPMRLTDTPPPPRCIAWQASAPRPPTHKISGSRGKPSGHQSPCSSKRSHGAVDGSSLRPTSLHLLCALRFHQSQINSKPHNTTFQCRLNQTWPLRESLMRPTQNPTENPWTARARRATRGFSAVQSTPHYHL